MSTSTVEVDRSDLNKVHDALAAAVRHHAHRDESNAALHLASTTRYSPLTSTLEAAYERVGTILSERPVL